MNKQVIILRRDLKMSPGKACTAAAHASSWALLHAMKEHHGEDFTTYTVKHGSPIHTWMSEHYKKIVLGVDSKDELMKIYNEAYSNGLPCRLQEDIGLTEFHGETNITGCAIGPYDEYCINLLTKHLKLY